MSKSSGAAFGLWLACIVGLCGLHRFYLGRYVSGVIWLLTLGLLGVGQLIDLFLINGMVRQTNEDDLLTRAYAAVVRGALSKPPPA